MCQAVLRLLIRITSRKVPAAARAHALATPGLAAAAVDLLMALGSEDWAAAKEEWQAESAESKACWEDLESTILMVLSVALWAGEAASAAAFDALTSRDALSHLLALLRSPNLLRSTGASKCIAALADMEAGCDALFLVPRAASELAAALRRAHADGEEPVFMQLHAASALACLLGHSQGARVAAGLACAAMAEGSAGSLLGALAGLLTASMASGGGRFEYEWNMLDCTTAVLSHMVAAPKTSVLHLLPVLQRAPLAEVCVRAVRYWLAGASDEQLRVLAILVLIVAGLAGLHPEQSSAAASADTAATRAALLREAPGMEGALQLFLAWARRQQPKDENTAAAVPAAKWLLRLPEVKAPTAASVSQPAAAAAEAAEARETAADPAVAAPSAAPSPAAAPAAPLPVAASLPAMQQPRDGSSSSGSSSSSSSGRGCKSEAAAPPPRACGGCGKSESEVRLLRCAGCKAQHYCGDACAGAHWPSHRAACKAAARRASAAKRS
jgi:hypothetical protein